MYSRNSFSEKFEFTDSSENSIHIDEAYMTFENGIPYLWK